MWTYSLRKTVFWWVPCHAKRSSFRKCVHAQVRNTNVLRTCTLLGLSLTLLFKWFKWRDRGSFNPGGQNCKVENKSGIMLKLSTLRNIGIIWETTNMLNRIYNSSNEAPFADERALHIFSVSCLMWMMLHDLEWLSVHCSALSRAWTSCPPNV